MYERLIARGNRVRWEHGGDLPDRIFAGSAIGFSGSAGLLSFTIFTISIYRTLIFDMWEAIAIVQSYPKKLARRCRAHEQQ
jgi:hypothetical protein